MAENQIVALAEKLIRGGPDAVAALKQLKQVSDPATHNSFPLCDLVRQLISMGNSRIAFELARTATVKSPEDLELRYLGALALARGGNSSGAAFSVSKLLSETGLSDAVRSDALSLKGRLLKDQVQRKRCDRKSSLAAESATAYEQAYEITRSLFPAINAATMWLIAGFAERSRACATTVHDAIRLNDGPAVNDDYWLCATHGESMVLLGDVEQAAVAYQRAVDLAGSRFGDIASMARQLRLLEDHIPAVKTLLPIFDLGRIAVFSGKMLDNLAHSTNVISSANYWEPSFERQIRDHIRSRLTEFKCRFAYCSAASGCDIIFCEVALELGLELQIVLPFDLDDFYQTSVDFGLPELASWRMRCDAVLKSASQVYYATREPYLGDDLLFEFANDIMQGLAVTRAAEFGSHAIALVVANLSSQGERGGAKQFLDKWTNQGHQADVLDLADRHGPPLVRSPTTNPTTRGAREIKSMLFADVKGFSKLREEQTLGFFLHFLREVAAILNKASVAPIFRNTWGDGLFLVFDSAPACAELALELCDRIARLDLTSLGLPEDLMVRVGIHAGPVFHNMDPILAKENFFGSHVNRAARIEPVTMPGCVYASEQMAAVLAISTNAAFHCEYIGQEDLAKGYDTCTLFHVIKA